MFAILSLMTVILFVLKILGYVTCGWLLVFLPYIISNVVSLILAIVFAIRMKIKDGEVDNDRLLAKLKVYFPGYGCGTLLAASFYVMKLMGTVTWSWWWIFSPILFELALGLTLTIIFVIGILICGFIIASRE